MGAAVFKFSASRQRFNLIILFQFRQKSSQVSQLEEQLHEKSAQSAHQVSRLSQLEETIGAHEGEAQTLHKELREREGALEATKTEKERIQKIHQEQCKDYQQQIDIVSFCLKYVT